MVVSVYLIIEGDDIDFNIGVNEICFSVGLLRSMVFLFYE